MVVDSSALIGILLGEVDAADLVKRLSLPERRFMSAFTWFETSVVIESKKGPQGTKLWLELASECELESIAFDASQAQVALDAWRRFGKGHHPASLNVGDCASYALAVTLNQKLLAKGDDFSKTDCPLLT